MSLDRLLSIAWQFHVDVEAALKHDRFNAGYQEQLAAWTKTGGFMPPGEASGLAHSFSTTVNPWRSTYAAACRECGFGLKPELERLASAVDAYKCDVDDAAERRDTGVHPDLFDELRAAVVALQNCRSFIAIDDPYKEPAGLTPTQADIWRVVVEAQRRMTTREILDELDQRGMTVGESAIKAHLATFTKRLRVWDNQRPSGYGFPDWPRES